MSGFWCQEDVVSGDGGRAIVVVRSARSEQLERNERPTLNFQHPTSKGWSACPDNGTCIVARRQDLVFWRRDVLLFQTGSVWRSVLMFPLF